MVFVVDSCSWRHSDILKKNFLGLVQEPTDDIDDSVPVAEKSFILILTNQEQSLFSLHDNVDESYLFINKTEILYMERSWWYTQGSSRPKL